MSGTQNFAAERRIQSNDILPIIDISRYLGGVNNADVTLAEELRKSCDDLGFFFITGHGISPDLLHEGFVQSARYFSLPLEEKMRMPMNESQCGYQPVKTSVYRSNLSEKNTKASMSEAFKFSFDLAPDDPDSGGDQRFRGQNIWPENLPGFQAFMQHYLQVFDETAKKLLAPLALSLNLEPTYFDPHFSRSTSSVRLAHYPQVPEAERSDGYGSFPHQDLSFLTMIPPTEVPGLDVLLPTGEWLEVPKLENAILVNTGLALESWTRGRYQATPHRVRIPQDTDRYSNIFFLYPNLEAPVGDTATSHEQPENAPKREHSRKCISRTATGTLSTPRDCRPAKPRGSHDSIDAIHRRCGIRTIGHGDRAPAD